MNAKQILVASIGAFVFFPGPSFAEGKDQPPTEGEILRAVQLAAPFEDVKIVSEQILNKVDAPRFFPFIGKAQLHRCHWKCTTYWTELSTVTLPVVKTVKVKRVYVVYIDKDYLEPLIER